MIHPSSRRQFFTCTGLAAAGLGLVGRVAADQIQNADDSVGGDELLFKLSLAQWSLHRKLDDGQLDNLNFPAYAKDNFGIAAVEYVNRYFEVENGEVPRAYLDQLRANCEEHGVKSVLIMVDGEGHIGAASEEQRQETVDKHLKWLRAAEALGCHAIRVNAYSEGSDQEQHERVVDGLGKLAEVAARSNLQVLVENHGGNSSNGEWLAGVMQELRDNGHGNVGTLPDFGNFHDYDRYQGLRDLMPFAGGVSAKSRGFDNQGNETQTDYQQAMEIVMEHGYHGYVGIEWEGGDISEDEGVLRTKNLLERVYRELAG